MRLFIITMILFVLVIAACEEEEDIVSGIGTIIYLDFEGGFYGIVTENNEHYFPENLGTDFQKDSTRVYFQGIITNHTTVQQWGRTLRLTHIQKIQ